MECRRSREVKRSSSCRGRFWNRKAAAASALQFFGPAFGSRRVCRSKGDVMAMELLETNIHHPLAPYKDLLANMLLCIDRWGGFDSWATKIENICLWLTAEKTLLPQLNEILVLETSNIYIPWILTCTNTEEKTPPTWVEEITDSKAKTNAQSHFGWLGSRGILPRDGIRDTNAF